MEKVYLKNVPALGMKFFFMVSCCFGCVVFRDDTPTGLVYSGSLHGKRVCFQEDGLPCCIFKMGLHCYRNIGFVSAPFSIPKS